MVRDQEVLIKLESDRYYILASSSYADDQTRVLNFGDTFAIFDRWGDAKQIGKGVQGIYHEGTRFVSDMEFRLNGFRPMLLSSNIKLENEIFSIDLTNPDMQLDHGLIIDKGLIHIERSKFLLEGICYESIILHNYDLRPYFFETSFLFKCDFVDIFEVRGMKRPSRGTILFPETTSDGSLKISYLGLDNIKRTTWVRFETNKEWIDGNRILYPVRLEPGGQIEIRYTIEFQVGENDLFPDTHLVAFQKIKASLEDSKEKIVDIKTSNTQFNNWIDRSKFDLISLLRYTEYGLYPYAGVPWYNTAFGRDGILTALSCLWIAPDIAKGVLLYLAANQALTEDSFRDAEPGKILHEARGGEMAELDEIPFKKYYGTIDATPLFISLAGHYYKRTADKQTIRSIWKNIQLALQWIENYGDIDGDGFVEYQQKMESGLFNQGWKDSHDSVSHSDGRIAQPSIALCEVQGYVYDAYLQAAYLADAMGNFEDSKMLRTKAKILKKKFDEVFWDTEMQTYVIALDGDKKPCRIKSSNAGQCLFTGIVPKAKAAKVVNSLMQADMYTGWGIRTLSSNEVRYNPMSYHNGSVWPHDTSLIALGMARYGFAAEAQVLLNGLYNACLFLDLQRLPELFCGFLCRGGEAPTAYPVACVPQAWAVASVFLLLQAVLNISIDAPQKIIYFNKPKLPDYLQNMVIKNLRVPDGVFELELTKHKWDAGIHTLAKPNNWKIVIHK